jgi:hypothetical protein
MTDAEEADLVSDLLAPIPRTAIVPAVRAALGISHKQTDRVVQAFDDFVAKPLEANLRNLHGRDLAKRNPMIYTVRGTESVEQWADQVLVDKETSAIEGTSAPGWKKVRGSSAAASNPAAASTSKRRTQTASCSSTQSSRRRTRRTRVGARATSRRSAAAPVLSAGTSSASCLNDPRVVGQASLRRRDDTHQDGSDRALR